jgi:hypothetical protein
VLLDLIHPVLDRTETLAVGDIVCHNDTVSTLIVRAGNGLESLLAGCVPLQSREVRGNAIRKYLVNENSE